MAARKTSLLPTRIWSYHARVHDEGAVLDLLRAANRYYNKLVEFERDRYARFHRIRRTYAPELAALEDQWEELDDRIVALIRDQKRARQEHWRERGEARRLLDEQIEMEIAVLRAEQKHVSALAKEHRKTFNEQLDPARAEYKRRATERAAGGGPRIKSAANAAVLEEMLAESSWSLAWKEIALSDEEAARSHRAARADSALPPGTYLQVDEAFQRAKKDSSPRPPRFRRFGGKGKLAVQLGNITFAELLAGTATCCLRPMPKDEPTRKGQPPMLVTMSQSSGRGSSRQERQITLTLRNDRIPPTDAIVKWAALVARRVGERQVYEFQLTLEHASFGETKRPSGVRAREHVRIGWARVDDGVRVACWPDGSVVVPDAILSQHEHAASIESAADRHFDRAKQLLKRWMSRGPHHLNAWHRITSDAARQQLRRWCVAYSAWILEGREHVLWKAWKSERLARSEDLYAPPWLIRRWLSRQAIHGQAAVVGFWAYCWARKDSHLCQYAVNSRRRFANRRDAFFRREAVRLATEFSELAIDNYRIASMKELPVLTLPGDAPRDQPQHNAQAAAPGRFREILLEVMGARCVLCERPSDAPKPRHSRSRKARQVGDSLDPDA